MNPYAPDFEMDHDYSLPPPPSTLNRPRKPAMQEEEIMELLWQNGQVVMHSQRSQKKSSSPPSKLDDAVLPADQLPGTKEIRSSHDQHQHHLFMQEDEMASWLHYPLNDTTFDHEFCADFLYPPTASTASITREPAVTSAAASPVRGLTQRTEPRSCLAVSAPRPPIAPVRRAEVMQNFAHFSRHRAANVSEPGPSNSKSVVRESTVVDSCDTPKARTSETAFARSADNTCGAMNSVAVAGKGCSAPSRKRKMTAIPSEMTSTSSPGCSSASAEPPALMAPVEDRKRKGREEEAECHSEDAEFESADAKKQTRGSTSSKRSRAAEVHNLSERRRRDRINEKMRALQELIPRCNKSDKASMLDEAIEYLKSLQLQVQMMSMGCSMVPMMFPGFQNYMPPMGMGMGMGIGMGIEMGLSRPVMPFPNVLASAPSATPAAAAHLGPSRFPVPPFHVPPIPAPDPSRVQPANQVDPMLGSPGQQNPNQPRVPNFVDPYQHYLGLHQMHIPGVPQNQAMAQPSTSRGAGNPDNHQSG